MFETIKYTVQVGTRELVTNPEIVADPDVPAYIMKVEAQLEGYNLFALLDTARAIGHKHATVIDDAGQELQLTLG